MYRDLPPAGAGKILELFQRCDIIHGMSKLFIYVRRLAGLCLLVATSAVAAPELDWGPLLARDTALDGEIRWRALGPLFEYRAGTNGCHLMAFRPLYSREHDFAERKLVQDVLWPVWFGKTWDDSANQWRFLVAVSWRDDDVNDPHARYSFQVVPFYFQGRNDAGQPYWALFPLGGTIRDFLFYDEVSFWLFPLFGRTRVGDLPGWFCLWPVIVRNHNAKVDRFRVFPFYGYSRRGDDFEKYFVLWPIWNYARYGYSGASGTGYMLFPFFGHVALEDQTSWMFLMPFFRFSRGEKLNQTYAPWPFVQVSHGMAEQTYFWPLWGRKTSPGRTYEFIVWPVCMRTRQFSKHNDRERRWVLPFVYFTDEDQKLPAPGIKRHGRKIWPLFTWQEENNHSLLRAPTLFPFRDRVHIDRNYAPFWTLYQRETTPEAMEQEALWGVFRHRRDADGNRRCGLFPLARYDVRPSENTLEWSLLWGAVGYRRAAGRRELHLLYFLRLPLAAAAQ